MTLHIRRIETDEATLTRDQLVELFVDYRAFYARRGDEAAARAFIDDRLHRADSRVWLAMEADVVAGFVQVYPHHSSLELTTDWTLNDLFVRPTSRGQGLGRSLVEHVVRAGRANRVCSIDLETQATNAVARALYDDLGFRLVPTDGESSFVTYRLDLLGDDR